MTLIAWILASLVPAAPAVGTTPHRGHVPTPHDAPAAGGHGFRWSSLGLGVAATALIAAAYAGSIRPTRSTRGPESLDGAG